MKPTIIVMSDTKDLDGEHQIINEMFESGLEILHIRKPKYSTNEMRTYIEKINKKYRNRVVIHSHHELCIPLKLRGIHLTERHRKKNFFRSWILMQWIKFRRPDIAVTASYHSPNSLLKHNPGYTYIFLSPIFDSISKIGYKNTFNDDSLEVALKKTTFNVIALGGVDYSKLEKVKEFGFNGCALVGSIWHTANPVAEFKRIFDKWNLLESSASA